MSTHTLHRLGSRPRMHASSALLCAALLARTGRADVAAAAVEPPSADAKDSAPREEVVISGSRAAQSSGSVHVMRGAQLERFGHDDPTRLLMQVPGVYMRGEDGVGLRPNIGIRGANPDRSKKLTLMEDGILFGPAPYSAPAAYYFPLLGRMTQVRVIKGPSAIAYGPQTVGGAIDFLTRQLPTQRMGAIDLSVGSFGYQKAHLYAGGGDERSSFLVEGIRLQNTGFGELASGADTGSTRNDWMVKAGYVLDPDARTKHRFQLKLSYADEVSNETYLGQSDADLRQTPYRRYAASALDQMKNHRSGIVLTHIMEGPETAYTLRTSAYRFDYTRAWNKLNSIGGGSVADILARPDAPENQSRFEVLRGGIDSSGNGNDTLYVGPNHRQFVSQGVQSVLTTRKQTGSVAHAFEAGLRLHYDSLQRLHTEHGYLMQGGTLVSAGGPTRTTTFNAASTHAAAVHLLDALTWKQLTLTPGLRMEFISSQAEDYLTATQTHGFTGAVLPGVGAFYALDAHLGVLGGVHRGFSPPPPGSGREARAEYSINYEAGGRYTKGRARLEAIAFFNDYSNLTNICTQASGCVDASLDRQFDAGRARIYGLEAAAAHELRTRHVNVPMSAAYTLSYGEFLSSFASLDPTYGTVRTGDSIPYIPRHQLSATAGAEGRVVGLNASLNYVAPMREIAGSAAIADTLATDEQLWLDVSGSWVVTKWLRVYGHVRNLTGAQNIVGRRPYGARVSAPTWLQLGFKATF